VQFGSSFSPGLILGRRRNRRGLWKAEVIYAQGDRNVEVSVHVQWLAEPT